MDEPEPTEKQDNLKEIPDFSDLDRRRAWVVLAAVFGIFLLIGGTVYDVGFIHIALLERFKQDITMTSWVGALHAAMMALGGPISATLADMYSCRVSMVTSGVCYVIGFLGTAFAPNIEVCILTCGIIAGFGTGGYTAALVVVGYNFKQNRNVAMGLASSGMSMGMFVMAPVFEAAREYYGNTGFFIALAGITANMIVLATLCFPSRFETYTQEKRKQEQMLKSKETSSWAWRAIRFYALTAMKKPVLCLCMCMFCFRLGTHLVFLHFPKYAVQTGSTTIQASFLASITGIMGVIGRILTGLAASEEKIDDILLYSGSMGIVSLATLLFPIFSYTFVGKAGYAVILGLYFASCYVVTGSVNMEFVGLDAVAAAIGIEFFCGGIGAIIGPVLAGVIVDHGGTYETSFIIAGGYMNRHVLRCFILLACGFAVATVVVSTTHEKNTKTCTNPSISVAVIQNDTCDISEGANTLDQLKEEEKCVSTRL